MKRLLPVCRSLTLLGMHLVLQHGLARTSVAQAGTILLADPIHYAATGSSPTGPGVGANAIMSDFTGDGVFDVLTTAGWGPSGTSPAEVFLRAGDGLGGFGPGTTSSIPGLGSLVISALAVADFDLDGMEDVAVSSFGLGAMAHILRNAGAGGFVLWASAGGWSPPVSLAAGDVDLDGDPDLISTVLLAMPGIPIISMVLNSGPGTMGFGPCGGSQPWAIASGETAPDSELRDLDGDMMPDYVGSGNVFQILRGLGQGCFQTFPPIWWTSGPPNIGTSKRYAFGDLNGDGAEDVVLAAGTAPSSPNITVYLGGGPAANPWNLGPTFFTPGFPTGVATGDLDADGDVDFLLTSYVASGPRVTTFENLGGGTGFALTEFTEGNANNLPSGPMLVDLNGDGLEDLVVREGALTPGGVSGFAVVMNASGFSDLEVIGLPQIGRAVHLFLAGNAGLPWGLFASGGTGPPLALPGFQGAFVLDPASMFLAAWGMFPSDGTTLVEIAIPNQPALVGAVVQLQQVAVDAPIGGGSFGVLRSVVIQ